MIVDVKDDHSLTGRDRKIIKQCDLVMGEDLLHNFIGFGEPKISIDETIDKVYNIEPGTFKETKCLTKASL